MEPQQQYAPNYLDQISAPVPSSGPSNKLFFGIVGGVLAVAIVILLLVLASAGGTSTSNKFDRLILRLNAMQTTSETAQDTIASAQLRSSNARLTSFVIQTKRGLTDIQAPSFEDPKKAPANLLKAENTDDLMSKLEDAQLNGIYDRTYAGEMAYLLHSTGLLMQSIYDSTKDSSLQESLSASYKDLQAIESQFTSYRTSTETSIFD